VRYVTMRIHITVVVLCCISGIRTASLICNNTTLARFKDAGSLLDEL
jgi:hypothetical protein